MTASAVCWLVVERLSVFAAVSAVVGADSAVLALSFFQPLSSSAAVARSPWMAFLVSADRALCGVSTADATVRFARSSRSS